MCCFFLVCLWFATIFTPQGDGNPAPDFVAIKIWRHSLRYLPRKGTETMAFFCWVFRAGKIRYDIYPARGRKLILVSHIILRYNHSLRYLPRKGTETIRCCWCYSRYGYSLRYLPRKGTETLISGGGTISIVSFATIFTPQGDGNTIRFRNWNNSLVKLFATIFTPQGDGNLLYLQKVNWLEDLFATIFTPQGDGNTVW